MAQPGGVLTRAGHTEAGCDLARLAGLEPAAVIVEILNEDGSMARRPDLEKFAREHDIKIGTIADLIRYRLEKERNVERIAEQKPCRRSTAISAVSATTITSIAPCISRWSRATWLKADAPLVRVHLQDTLGDVIGVQSARWAGRCSAIERIAQEDAGVIVLLRDHETSRDFMDAVERLASIATS